MKKIKILGIAVATLGVAASVGGAIALYTKPATPTTFTIDAGTHTDTDGSILYKINNQQNPTVTPKFLTTGESPEEGVRFDSTHTQIRYEFVLGATFTNGLTPNFVTGNLAISLTKIPAAYQGKLSVWAALEQYESNSLGEYFYSHVFMTSDFAITNEEGHGSYVANHDVAVASSGVQRLVIYLKYSNVMESEDDFYAKDEASLGYELSVTWGAPSSGFKPAYIVNDKTAFQPDDAFAMSPNIGKEGFSGYLGQYGSHEGAWEWCGAVKGETGVVTLAKCYKDGNWSGGDNEPLTNDVTYDVYWSGENDAPHYFVARS